MKLTQPALISSAWPVSCEYSARGLWQQYPLRILNIHPSLLPAFAGVHAQRQALLWGAKVTGCTVHFVDEELDHGPIIAQYPVPILEGDTEESLSDRILVHEHEIYPEALKIVCEERYRIEGRRLIIKPEAVPAEQM